MGLSLKDLGSRLWDQVNTLDNNRTWQQRAPTNTRSVIGQLSHNAATNTVGNFVTKPIIAQNKTIYNAWRAAGAKATGNQKAYSNARKDFLKSYHESMGGQLVDQARVAGISLGDLAFRAPIMDLTGNQAGADQVRTEGLRAFSQFAPSLAVRPIQRGIFNVQHTTPEQIQNVGISTDQTGAQQYFMDPLLGAAAIVGMKGKSPKPKVAVKPSTKINVAKEEGGETIPVNNLGKEADQIREAITTMPNKQVAKFEAKRNLAKTLKEVKQRQQNKPDKTAETLEGDALTQYKAQKVAERDGLFQKFRALEIETQRIGLTKEVKKAMKGMTESQQVEFMNGTLRRLRPRKEKPTATEFATNQNKFTPELGHHPTVVPAKNKKVKVYHGTNTVLEGGKPQVGRTATKKNGLKTKSEMAFFSDNQKTSKQFAENRTKTLGGKENVTEYGLDSSSVLDLSRNWTQKGLLDNLEKLGYPRNLEVRNGDITNLFDTPEFKQRLLDNGYKGVAFPEKGGKTYGVVDESLYTPNKPKVTPSKDKPTVKQKAPGEVQTQLVKGYKERTKGTDSKTRTEMANRLEEIKADPAYRAGRPQEFPSGKPVVSTKARDTEMLDQGTMGKSVDKIKTMPGNEELGGPKVTSKGKPKVGPRVSEWVGGGKKPVYKMDIGLDAADPFGNKNWLTRAKNFGARLFTDDAELSSLIRTVEKRTGVKGLADDVEYYAGNIRHSPHMANTRMINDENIQTVFHGLTGKLRGNTRKEFDNFAIAVAEYLNYNGKKTSRSRKESRAIIDAAIRKDPEVIVRFQAMNRVYKDLAEARYQSGEISKKKRDFYVSSDSYIKMSRDMGDLLHQNYGSNKARFLGSSTTRFRRKGSEREALSPTETMIAEVQRAQLAFNKQLYTKEVIKHLERHGLAKVTKKDHVNKIPVWKKGIKVEYEVHPEIKKIMESVNPYELGVIGQVISFPVRVARAGMTGLSVPFAGVNYVRDQGSSAIISKNVRATHSVNQIYSGLSQAVVDFGKENHNPLWKTFDEHLGNNLTLSEARGSTGQTQFIRELSHGTKGKATNRLLHPLRTVEDLISITEKATRFQNFKGIYEAARKDGFAEDQAIRKAVVAARNNSVDFTRGSPFTRTMGLMIPYFNAGMQGSRTLTRAFIDRPVATTMKTAAGVVIPTMAATFYNLSDDKRREVYNSLNEYEKKDNIIIVGPDAHQLADGTWQGVWKLPKPQGFRELSEPGRVAMERYLTGQSSQTVNQMMLEMLGAFTGPIQTGSWEQAGSSVIPQAIKPTVQAKLNKDFYGGYKIIPDHINNAEDINGKPIADELKARKGTSGSAREIANMLNVSPILVEKWIGDTAGSVGKYAINTADNIMNKMGEIPEEQIGGKSIKSDVLGRVAQARGELLDKNKTAGQKYFESVEKATKDLNPNEEAAWKSLHPQKKNFLGQKTYEGDSIYNAASRLDIYNRFPKVYEADKKLDEAGRKRGDVGNPLFDLTKVQLKKVLEKEALPPGAKDPELSNLYASQEWFRDYKNNKDVYFQKIQEKLTSNLASAKKKGDKEAIKAAEASLAPFTSSTNPYPTPTADLQKAMDYYNKLGKGTGERSGFIRANPGIWKEMQDYYASVDTWQNNQREKRGLARTEGDEGEKNGFNTDTSSGYSSYGKSGYSRGGRSSKDKTSPFVDKYKYVVNNKPVGPKIRSTSVSIAKPQVAAARKIAKPKVSIKKARV